MTLDALNNLADSTPDSNNTIPGEILFFRQNSSIGESLKKLRNHNFKIGYSFSINVFDSEYTKVVAYNKKNDIFSGWSGFVKQDDEMKEVFPLMGNGFSCYLNMPRIDDMGNLKLYRENMVSFNRQTSYAKKMFKDLKNLNEVNDLSLYGYFWPILENADVESFRRNQQFESREFSSDIAMLCNVYKFDETYKMLDDGLMKIYKVLFEEREKMFCEEYQTFYDNDYVIEKALDYLELTEEDVKDMFDRNNMTYPVRMKDHCGGQSSLIKVLEKVLFYPKKYKNYK